MPPLLEIARSTEPPVSSGTAVVVGATRIALFVVDGAVLAVEDACARCAGPIAGGTVSDRKVTCPRCGWRYDLVTGAADQVAEIRLHTFRTRTERARILIEWTGGTE